MLSLAVASSAGLASRAEVAVLLDDQGDPIILYGFARDGSGWRTVDSVTNAPTRWTRCLDGRAIGEVDDGREDGSTLGRSAFAGGRSWGLESGERIHRPLVLSSLGHCKDPDRWKRQSLPAPVLAQLREAFEQQSQLAGKPKAGASDGSSQCGEKPVRHEPGAVKVIASYGSGGGSWLATLSMGALYRGDGIVPCNYQRLTFLLSSPRSLVKFLGYNLTLIDAGDYGGTGESALVFFEESTEDPLDSIVFFWNAGAEQVSVRWRGN